MDSIKKALTEEELETVTGGDILFRYPNHPHPLDETGMTDGKYVQTEYYSPTVGMIISINNQRYICSQIYKKQITPSKSVIDSIKLVGYDNPGLVAYISITGGSTREIIIEGYDTDFFK